MRVMNLCSQVNLNLQCLARCRPAIEAGECLYGMGWASSLKIGLEIRS